MAGAGVAGVVVLSQQGACPLSSPLPSAPTVLQGVDNSLVGLHNQSFARVMEQRLAQLFMLSQQQGRRFKRATTLGSYTVQVGVREASGVFSYLGEEGCAA